MKTFIRECDYGHRVEVYIWQPHPSKPDSRQLLVGDSLVEHDVGCIPEGQKYTFQVNRKDLPGLIEELTRILHKGGQSLPIQDKILGQLEATKEHLRDMRHLVFGTIPHESLNGDAPDPGLKTAQ